MELASKMKFKPFEYLQAVDKNDASSVTNMHEKLAKVVDGVHENFWNNNSEFWSRDDPEI